MLKHYTATNIIHMGKLISGNLFIGSKIDMKFVNCIELILSTVDERIKFEFKPLFSELFQNLLCDIEESKTLFSMPIPQSLNILREEYVRIIDAKICIENEKLPDPYKFH